MDIATHALASVALTRAAWPRAPRAVWLIAIIAGVVADLDALSSQFGAQAYLTWHRTYTHSILASLLFAIFCSGICRLCLRGGRSPDLSSGSQQPSRQVLSPVLVVLVALSAQWLHLAMDILQWEDTALFWPFSSKRIALDWLPSVDPWILIILVAAIALPELLRLVSSEIGAKTKRPRGRIGAMIGFVLIFGYIGTRAILHSDAIALLESRTYGDESPRRVAAFPEAISIFSWHGIVETERALHEMPVNPMQNSAFDPEKAVSYYKPEPSPELNATLNTKTARFFLHAARFPKATVQKTEIGDEIEIVDLRYAAANAITKVVEAIIDLTPQGKIEQEELRWTLHQAKSH